MRRVSQNNDQLSLRQNSLSSLRGLRMDKVGGTLLKEEGRGRGRGRRERGVGGGNRGRWWVRELLHIPVEEKEDRGISTVVRLCEIHVH